MCDDTRVGVCMEESDFKTKDLGGQDVNYCARHLIYHVRVLDPFFQPKVWFLKTGKEVIYEKYGDNRIECKVTECIYGRIPSNKDGIIRMNSN